MGLDTVLLLQEVEEYFGVEISNAEVEQIYTVEDFAKCIYKHITPDVDVKCKTQVMFYKLRNFFCDEFALEKIQIRLSTSLSTLIPIDERQKVWLELEGHLQLKLPKLSKADFSEKEVYTYKFFGLYKVKAEKAIFNHTAADLTKWIVSLNYKNLYNTERLCSESEVLQVLMGFMSDKLAIPIEEITLASSITNDFGLD